MCRRGEKNTMNDAADIKPRSQRGRLLRDYDIKEIDNPDKRCWWHLRYMERIQATMLTATSDVCAPALILEIGASQANMSLMLAEAGYATVALDISLQALQYAGQKWEKGLFLPLVGDAVRLPLGDAVADVVLLPEVLEHIPDPLHVLAEARRVVKPAGRIVLTTPNTFYLTEKLPDYVKGQKPATDELGPEGHHHLYAFSHRTLRELAAEADLVTVSARYVGSVIHSKYLRWLYRLFPTHLALAFGRLINATPLLRHRLSQTCLMVFTPQDGGRTNIGHNCG